MQNPKLKKFGEIANDRFNDKSSVDNNSTYNNANNDDNHNNRYDVSAPRILNNVLINATMNNRVCCVTARAPPYDPDIIELKYGG